MRNREMIDQFWLVLTCSPVKFDCSGEVLSKYNMRKHEWRSLTIYISWKDLTLYISFRRIPKKNIPKQVFEDIFVMPVAKEWEWK